MKSQIVQQGAEAVLVRCGDKLVKRRVEKGYRIKELDERIRRLRTRSEGKLLEKAEKIVPTPEVLKVDEKNREIEMEFISGVNLSEGLDEMENWGEICYAIGKNIAKLHEVGIIHGDLTTSNMIWSKGKLYFIDFGLGFANGRVEDKAVDLYLIKEALEAKHFLHFEKFFNTVLGGYRASSKNAEDVLKRLEKVEKRGRYKQNC